MACRRPLSTHPSKLWPETFFLLRVRAGDRKVIRRRAADGRRTLRPGVAARPLAGARNSLLRASCTQENEMRVRRPSLTLKRTVSRHRHRAVVEPLEDRQLLASLVALS